MNDHPVATMAKRTAIEATDTARVAAENARQALDGARVRRRKARRANRRAAKLQALQAEAARIAARGGRSERSGIRPWLLALAALGVVAAVLLARRTRQASGDRSAIDGGPMPDVFGDAVTEQQTAARNEQVVATPGA